MSLQIRVPEVVGAWLTVPQTQRFDANFGACFSAEFGIYCCRWSNGMRHDGG